MMKYAKIIPLFVFPLVLVSCVKDLIEPANDGSQDCMLDGNRMEWSIEGSSMCADTFIDANYGGDVMSVHGVSAMISSFSLDLEDVEPGVHAFNSSSNFALLTQLGFPWVSSDTLNGSYEIELFDQAHYRIVGNLNVELINEMTGEVRTVTGEFDVSYSD